MSSTNLEGSRNANRNNSPHPFSRETTPSIYFIGFDYVDQPVPVYLSTLYREWQIFAVSGWLNVASEAEPFPLIQSPLISRVHFTAPLYTDQTAPATQDPATEFVVYTTHSSGDVNRRVLSKFNIYWRKRKQSVRICYEQGEEEKEDGRWQHYEYYTRGFSDLDVGTHSPQDVHYGYQATLHPSAFGRTLFNRYFWRYEHELSSNTDQHQYAVANRIQDVVFYLYE